MSKSEDRMRKMLEDHYTHVEKMSVKSLEKRMMPMFFIGVLTGIILISATPVGYLMGVVTGFLFTHQLADVGRRLGDFFMQKVGGISYRLAPTMLECMSFTKLIPSEKVQEEQSDQS